MTPVLPGSPLGGALLSHLHTCHLTGKLTNAQRHFLAFVFFFKTFIVIIIKNGGLFFLFG